ncbi:MAG TPA: LysR family transcriptional regulator [Actinocrinis sp.]|uniref:LysR family transcriptional regulator n=1 Tax=Actinocrinis sp. TaxID=1920516 RepID=UPI002DDD100B|nr:LysR family transcriptional regulator [Actinocrinis sp.]HEV2344630.1 LysR family transcriptional regulator [Actinocrinis sp.]
MGGFFLSHGGTAELDVARVEPDLGVGRLRSFVCLADELHFGRAAQRLYISQPALSQQIARLERDLGVQLFMRTGRAVRLTPAGLEFLAGAHRALDALRDAVAAAREHGCIVMADS